MNRKHIFFMSLFLNFSIGFLINIILVRQLGTGTLSDMLFLSISISSLLIMIFTAGLSNYYIVELSSVPDIKEKNKKISLYFTIYTLLFLVSSVVIIPLSILSKGPLFSIIAGLSVLGGLFTAGGGIYNALYYSVKKQHVWEFVNALVNILALLFLLLFPLTNSDQGLICGSIVLFLKALIPFAINTINMKTCLITFDFYAIKNEAKRMISLVGVSIYYKSEQFLDRLILSNSSGLLTKYHISSQIYNTLSTLEGKIIVSPLMASAVTNCQNKDNVWNRSLLLVSVISLLMVITITVLEFTISPVLGKSFPLVVEYFHVIWLMSIYGAVTLIGQVVSSWFYIRRKYRTPIFISAVNFSFAIPAKLLSYSSFGLVGLIVSTTIYHLLNVLIMFLFILRIK